MRMSEGSQNGMKWPGERKSSRLLTLGRENQCNYRCDTLLNLFLLTLPTQEAATQNERNEAAEAQLAARCFLYDIIEGTGTEKSFTQRLKANLKPFLEKLSGIPSPLRAGAKSWEHVLRGLETAVLEYLKGMLTYEPWQQV